MTDPVPPVEEEMTAISTILSPLASTNTVMIFSSNKNRTLQLELRELGGKALSTLGWGDKAAPGPKLAYPSSIVAMQHNSAICVYGVTGESSDNLKLSLMSPVYEPLSEGRPKTGSLGGISTLDGSRYLYYQGTSVNESRIIEYSQTSNGIDFRNLGTDPIMPGTGVFAFRHDRFNWVVYQQKTGTISLYNVGARKESIIPGSADLTRAKTPVAACVIPAQGNRKARIYIYFVGKNERVVSANAEMAESLSFNTKDEKPSEVTELGQGQNPVLVESWSQLSVQPCPSFPVPDNTQPSGTLVQPCNVLFVLKKETSRISQVPVDPWPKE